MAIDGQTVRRSQNPSPEVPALHRVSAWAPQNHLVLAPQAVADHSNEITAIPALLQLLALQGCIVTLDRGPHGWGCQKAIAQPMRDQEADYVLTVKANPTPRHDQMVDTFGDERSQGFADCPHDDTETVAKGHGRSETRRGGVIGDRAYRPYVDPAQAGTDRQRLVLVEAERRWGHTVTTPVRSFIACLPPKASVRLAAVRGHGGLEHMPCPGCWLGPAGKMTGIAASVRPLTSWPSGGAAPGTSCNRSKRRASVSPISVCKPPGIQAIGANGCCSCFRPVRMPSPWGVYGP